MLNAITRTMQNKKLYWKGIEQLDTDSNIVEGLENNEFVEKLPVNSNDEKNSSRRDFFLLAPIPVISSSGFLKSVFLLFSL